MNIQDLNTFFKSPTARLAGTYLAIIMILSIGFSLVFYHTSSSELGRQIPPDSFFNRSYNQGSSNELSINSNGNISPPASVNNFLHKRADEGRSALMTKLILLNVGALAVGGIISYVLARRSLEPIEEAMEAQTQFVSDASHELRTPLTAIQTSNEVFLRKPHTTIAQAKEVISQNTEDVKRLKALSDGLLNLAGHQNIKLILSSVNLQDTVSEAMNQVVNQAMAKDIAVNDEVPNLNVLADKASLAQAIIILLDNAVKYSNEHGTVTLRATKKGKHATLQVSDTGIGIRASDLPHIFRRFYRADAARTIQAREGYGLGLAIAKQIISSQNGEIQATSEPGKGSTFSIKLPLA
jgi:two-component system sensor histidine kinase CiaH